MGGTEYIDIGQVPKRAFEVCMMSSLFLDHRVAPSLCESRMGGSWVMASVKALPLPTLAGYVLLL